MTDAATLRTASGRVLEPLTEAGVITFEVTRGSFTIPAELLADPDDYELRRLFARSLPSRAPGVTVETTRRALRGCGAIVTWRRIVTRERRA